jgi:hypothetical protein
MPTNRYVTSVSCLKIEKKGRPDKKMIFNLSIQWSDGFKEEKVIDYLTLFDFRSKLSDKYKEDDEVTVPVLPAAKKFDRGFLRGSSFEKRKAALEDFFQKLLSLPERVVAGETVCEFFNLACMPVEGNARNSRIEEPKTPPAAAHLAGDFGHYESIDCEAGAYASICLSSDPKHDGVTQQESAVEPIYWAVYSYTGRKSGEVTLHEGASVSVVQRELSGWWFVQVKGTKEQGWAPASCLLPEDRKHLADMTVTEELGDFRTLCDHDASNPDELSYKKNEKLEVLEARMDGWWKVRCGGKVGLIAAINLEPIVEKNSKKRSSIYHHVTLYRKNSPPPRRKEDDSVEELYAKVNKIQQRAPQVPKKLPNLDKLDAEQPKLPVPTFQQPTVSSQDAVECLYSEIGELAPLSPEDYKTEDDAAALPTSDNTNVSYATINDKPDNPKPTGRSYVNVDMTADGKPQITKPLPSPPLSAASGEKNTETNSSTKVNKPPVPVKPQKVKNQGPPLPIRADSVQSDNSDGKFAAVTPTANDGVSLVQVAAKTPARPSLALPPAAEGQDKVKLGTSGSDAAAAAVPANTMRPTMATSPISSGHPVLQKDHSGQSVRSPPSAALSAKSQVNGVLGASVPSSKNLPSPTSASPAPQLHTAVSVDNSVVRILKLDRSECERLLTTRGKEQDFVIRESTKSGCPYALSVLASDRVHHFPIELTPEKKFYIGHYSFSSLREVLAYYHDNALCITDDGLNVTLGRQLAVNPSMVSCSLSG